MKKQIFIISIILFGSFALLSMTALKSNVQEEWEVPAKYQKMENPYADTADADNIGRILYSKHCKSCHGSKGKGDGTKADSIDTEMGDFTDGSLKDQTDGTFITKLFLVEMTCQVFKRKLKLKKNNG